MATHHRGNDMTDTPTPPDGWYPDPAGSGGLRRWDGAAWTDDVRPSAPDASAAPAPASVPAAQPVAPPVPPVSPASPEADTPAPAGSATNPAAPANPGAPTYPGAPTHPEAPAYPGSAAPATPDYPGSAAPAYPGSAAPAYPAAPTATSTNSPARRDIPTNTVWIWLVVALPLLSVVVLFLFDWTTFVQESIYASAFPEQAPYAASSSLAVSAGASVFSFVIAALTVLFSFLDWRQLRARGIEKPFHWAFSFFVLVISSGGVYIIGRAVILRRQTGKGLGPVWGWIAVTVATIVALAIWVVVLVNAMLPLIEELQYYNGY